MPTDAIEKCISLPAAMGLELQALKAEIADLKLTVRYLSSDNESGTELLREKDVLIAAKDAALRDISGDLKRMAESIPDGVMVDELGRPLNDSKVRGLRVKALQMVEEIKTLSSGIPSDSVLDDGTRCKWTQEDAWDFSEVWNTECGNAFCFTEEGEPGKDGIDFCCYCGKPIIPVHAKEEAPMKARERMTLKDVDDG